MTDQSDTPDSADVPEHLAERLQELDGEQLRATIHFAQKLHDRRHGSISERLEAEDDVVSVEEQPGHTLVVRREEEGLVLYRVTTVRDLDGTESLDWHYIGPVNDG